MHVKQFAELNPDELYAILQLRVDVFVVEQHCAYPELDGRDRERATRHVWYARGDQVLAYIRTLVEPGGGSSIGRVVTAPQVRGQGLARQLIDYALEELELGRPIQLSAQAHLADWYARSGFVVVGDEYLEDGIPHVPMQWIPPSTARAD